MVDFQGDSRAARCGSVWIHWWSPVASANALMRCLGHLEPVAQVDLLADPGLQGSEDSLL